MTLSVNSEFDISTDKFGLNKSNYVWTYSGQICHIGIAVIYGSLSGLQKRLAFWQYKDKYCICKVPTFTQVTVMRWLLLLLLNPTSNHRYSFSAAIGSCYLRHTGRPV